MYMGSIAMLLVVIGLVLILGHQKWGRWYKPIDLKKVRSILSKDFTYYQRLSAEQRKTFEQRVIRLIRQKTFVGRGLEVTLAMKVLIAAAAVQFTFGLPEMVLRHFKRILVYPDKYYSTITHRYHKGEVNPAAQAIVLSWNNFVEGYASPSDSLNLGLHEMAHALEIENLIDNDEYDFLPPAVWQQWQQQSAACRNRMKTEPVSFFRAYAATNDQEFFAIAVENFFERPTQFQETEPELYNTLTLLLRQNPARRAYPTG